MGTSIFYTTNAGIYISSCRAEILVDGIHDAAAVGFEPMADEMESRLNLGEGLFAGSGLLLFTHLHKDHYDAGKVRRYLEDHPQTALWGPGLKARGVEVTGETLTDDDRDPARVRMTFGDCEITAYRTGHSGESFRYIPHYSFLIKNGEGESVLIAGDALFDPQLAETVRADAGDADGPAVFVTAYQLIEKPSRAFLEALAPRTVYLIHQPAAGSEVSRSLTAITDYVRRYPPEGIRIEEPAPMHWIQSLSQKL